MRVQRRGVIDEVWRTVAAPLERSAAQERSTVVRARSGLVGRAVELARLTELSREAAAGAFRCVLLEGEPGIGRTRLTHELLGRAPSGTALLARAHPLSATTSFGLWVEALDSHLHALPDEEVVRLCGGFLDDLGTLFRSVARLSGGTRDHDVPRPRLLEGLGVLVRNLVARAPLMIAFDDVHLADAASWDALHYLATRPRPLPILVVLSAGATELADRPLALRVLLDLEQEGLLERHRLAPLGEQDLRLLAATTLGVPVGETMSRWLVEQSRGNPLIAVALVEAFRREGGDLHHPVLRSVPRVLADRVLLRVAPLGGSARRVVDLLATAGGSLALRALIRCGGWAADELPAVLHRLLRSGLLIEENRDHEYVYELSHPLVADVVYADAVGAQRVVLHRTVGRALLGVGRLGEAAMHVARAASCGDDEAIEVLRRALRQAEERAAYRESLDLLGALFRVVPPGDSRWRLVAEDLSRRAEWVADHRADTDMRRALGALREIDSALGDDDDAEVRATVKTRMATFLLWGTGELEEATRQASASVELRTAIGLSTETLLGRLEFAYAKGLGGNMCAQLSEAAGVLRQAEELDDPYAVHHALGVAAAAFLQLGRFEDAESALRRSIDIARDLRKPYRETRGWMNLGWTLGCAGRPAEAFDAFRTGKSVYPGWRDTLLTDLEASVRWLAGDLTGAVGCARESALLDPSGFSLRRGIGLCFGALAAVELDEVDEARRFANAARRVYGDRSWYFASDYARYAEAMVTLREGRVAESLAAIWLAADGLVSRGAGTLAAPVLLDIAEVAADVRPSAAVAAADQAQGIAARTGLDLYRAIAALTRSDALRATGHDADAMVAAERAVRLLVAVPCEVLRGRAHLAVARAARRDNPRAALAAVTRAVATFEGCRALWRRDQALEWLRRLGDTARRTDGRNGEAARLTDREREVARLASRRLTAKEIAGELYVSRRTVESHLAKIYAKLGIHSKAELASMMAAATDLSGVQPP